MTNRLMTFEREIMRKIFGPTRTDDGYWRIKTNQEINDILRQISPVTGLEWPRVFQEVKVPRLHDNGTEWW